MFYKFPDRIEYFYRFITLSTQNDWENREANRWRADLPLFTARQGLITTIFCKVMISVL